MPPQIDEGLLKRLAKLLEKPKTIEQLLDKTGASRRTIYRYLTRLNVERVGIGRPTQYRMLP
jgi:predicted DNA-binding transcriptional regulator AlpA